MPLTLTPPSSSTRMPVLAENIVATSQPLAVQAGIDALRACGNAVDAALAAAITLTVVEPTSNGLGSDAFCILWDGKQLHGLNSSGRSPAAAGLDDFAGRTEMPLRGWESVTTPGCVAAWVALSERFGKLPFERLFDAAIHYAEQGFPVSPRTAVSWARAPEQFAGIAEFAPFLPGGRAPKAGERFLFPEQAASLRQIAESRGEAFYRGELAEKIEAAAVLAGAKLRATDLAGHTAEWVTPLALDYHAHSVCELPPNGQGLAALIALGILDELGAADLPLDSADSLHLQIEAMKLAFADAHRYIADPEALELPPEALLTPDYLRRRAALVSQDEARDPEHGHPAASDTVYLTCADAQGVMVSFIQSNFHGFGAGIVVPGTGISLQNRAAGFCLTPGHPNCFAGGKRPYHTIIPGFVMQNGQPRMSFGVMGGAMQPQGHVQMVLRTVDYQQNPQTASDAPRWQVLAGKQVAMEPGFPPQVLEDLRRRGHELCSPEHLDPAFSMGGAQLIYRTENGYIAGSDHRKDGLAAGF